MSKPTPEALQLVKNLMALPENSICSDCQKKAAKWASSTLGVFICIDCSGIHRSLGTHISFVRSCTLDSWTPEQARLMKRVGNKVANEFWEARLPPDFPRPNSGDRFGMEQFIRAKYVEGRWADPNQVPPQNRKGGIAGRPGARAAASSMYEGYYQVQQQQTSQAPQFGQYGHPKQLSVSQSADSLIRAKQEAAVRSAPLDLNAFENKANAEPSSFEFINDTQPNGTNSSFDFINDTAPSANTEQVSNPFDFGQAPPATSNAFDWGNVADSPVATPPPPNDSKPSSTPPTQASPISQQAPPPPTANPMPIRKTSLESHSPPVFEKPGPSTAQEIMKAAEQAQEERQSHGRKPQRLFKKSSQAKGVSRFMKRDNGAAVIDQMLSFDNNQFRPVSAPVRQQQAPPGFFSAGPLNPQYQQPPPYPQPMYQQTPPQYQQQPPQYQQPPPYQQPPYQQAPYQQPPYGQGPYQYPQ